MKTEDLELLDYELVVLIRRTSLDKELGGLDRSTYTLLTQLSKSGPVGVKALASEFRLDISTISRQTTVLEAKGYIRRLPDPMDGRSSNFEVTEEGMYRVMEAKKARLARHAQLFKDWTDEERQTFGALLARLNRTFIE
ncbi:MarR family winged helix-turn-helix transcriptional regulator [Paenibacillus alba]|uniref:MarR family transcriptional regulator n=1 Tax=Paenibacillus alba TaxID=1197127 RepID=A0ABU6G3C2_9BACL|nr:MarR family transcriptional regulator [Paenibacillus alba]MEC0227259.1 MarR family transcriptional regulator [Paenibacillus alba]NQX67616.1 MarR family transcriptional regulator [Paenibacillus alba]